MPWEAISWCLEISLIVSGLWSAKLAVTKNVAVISNFYITAIIFDNPRL